MTTQPCSITPEILDCIRRALAEDIGPGDVTTNAIVPVDAEMKGRIIAKQDGIVAGLDVARAVYEMVDPRVSFTAYELGRLLPDFEQRGVQVVAVSSDGEERSREMATKVNGQALRMGYGLSLQGARQWGLNISTSRGKTSIGIDEPALFSEPGLFLVRPDGTLYWGSTQTMPFARPHFDEILGAIDFVVKNDYPARGEYTGAV